MSDNLITIITPTYNCSNELPNLVQSLKSQTDLNFKWLVYDAQSTDSTVELIKNSGLDYTLYIEEDFGIVHALNKAIVAMTTEYYIFCGADDILYPDAIEIYKKEILKDKTIEIITAPIIIDNKIVQKRRVPKIIGFQMTLISGHAVGCCIKKSIHNKVGLYSKKYWACADAHFIMKSFYSGARIGYVNDVVVGKYGVSGESAVYAISAICGIFRIQTEDFGWNLPLCLLILNLKLIKFWLNSNFSKFYKRFTDD